MAIGEKQRRAVKAGRLRPGHRDWQTADCRYTLQGARGRSVEEDDALAVPRPEPAVRCVTQGLGRATVKGDPLELSFGEESYRAVVGRPERIRGVVRSV